jgi:aspartate carbamoyltransferase catalytic subunit
VPDIRAVGPKTLVPGDLREMGVRVCHDMAEGIRGADVIIMLRLQNERMSGAMLPSAGEFFKSYGLTAREAGAGQARRHRDAPGADQPRRGDRLRWPTASTA